MSEGGVFTNREEKAIDEANWGRQEFSFWHAEYKMSNKGIQEESAVGQMKPGLGEKAAHYTLYYPVFKCGAFRGYYRTQNCLHKWVGSKLLHI